MSTCESLDSFVGKQVIDVAYSVHFHPQSAPSRLGLVLSFERQANLTLRNAPDGIGLICEEQNPEVFDLGQYGEVKLVSSVDYDPDRTHRLIGEKVLRIEPRFDADGRTIEMQIAFSNSKMRAYNDDDNLVISVS